MGRTKIEWADAVWNPVTGCTPVSEGCKNCYAERMSKRLAGRCGYPEDEPFRVTLHPEKLNEPWHWKKPRRVFVCSMGDLFHEDVPDDFILKVFLQMTFCPSRHIFMVLTKRPKRMKDIIEKFMGQMLGTSGKTMEEKQAWPHKRVWLGVTVENQEMANERIPILLKIPATVRFVSCEPLLGPVDLSKWLGICEGCGVPATKCGPVLWHKGQKCCPDCTHDFQLNWVIAGGETGPGARPMHPEWVRSLRDQCQEAGVPFFFKSWGEYKPLPYSDRGDGLHTLTEYKGCKYDFVKVGKKNAGSLLDGRTWDEFPDLEG
ncbi:DUF5131 family protein [Carboxydothermus pertinax]|uniref:Phage Gp37/Gp68 family protein n=1 Tax=Carboxydothermus pertinax TaxID=870242 RepID=A0A1L8CRN4_9THEO|nr:phage Gp37/Gp68 family protein [Carboxydothermus pertinax]GAV21582.1 hypothetical protein cpu_00920 [Carboxydothermus pertinax]